MSLQADHEIQIASARASPARLTFTRHPNSRTLLHAGWDLHLDGRQGYLSVDGNAPELLDAGSGQRRASTKADLARLSRLADALPEIAMLWQPVTARDMPTASQSLHELHAQLTNTSKHILLYQAMEKEVPPPAAR